MAGCVDNLIEPPAGGKAYGKGDGHRLRSIPDPGWRRASVHRARDPRRIFWFRAVLAPRGGRQRPTCFGLWPKHATRRGGSGSGRWNVSALRDALCRKDVEECPRVVDQRYAGLLLPEKQRVAGRVEVAAAGCHELPQLLRRHQVWFPTAAVAVVRNEIGKGDTSPHTCASSYLRLGPACRSWCGEMGLHEGEELLLLRL